MWNRFFERCFNGYINSVYRQLKVSRLVEVSEKGGVWESGNVLYCFFLSMHTFPNSIH